MSFWRRLRTARADAALSSRTIVSEIENEAHTLKGSSSTFGLIQLATLGRTLEYAAHQIAPDDYRDLIDRIEAAFAASRDAVEAAMSEHLIRPR